MHSRQPGDWAFSLKHQEPVKIIEHVELWDYSIFRAWIPSRDEVVRFEETDLADLAEANSYTKDRLVYTVSAARIAESLAMPDTMLAPLEGSVTPLPHQIYALRRAISSDGVRYLLADEVGLGKTIEAGLIMRELKLRGLVNRVLVVAPKGLVTQWVQEMETHFKEEFQLIDPSALTALSPNRNPWEHFDQVVVSMDSVKPVDSRRGWNKEQLSRYNRERFESLVAARWDLVIIDEAHRAAGSSDTVARHRLGKALAEATPYVLLLTATPHQGKSDAFRRLLTLLDEQAFPSLDAVVRERVLPYVIRTEKRKAVDARGNPLFTARNIKLVSVASDDTHTTQRELYEAVTDYVREGYNQAVKQKRNYICFLMVLMQRLVASSTAAISSALKRRLEVIENKSVPDLLDDADLAEEWWELDGQEQLEEVLNRHVLAFANEHEEVRRLIDLAEKCIAQGPDARAEALLEWMYQLQADEGDPELKFLIFTEFVATQEMLKRFLEERGFTTTCLNGSMDLAKRREVQQTFAGPARVLISTDAGGEGLNLQFCHVVINYDLPWNPMRIEQRIGRVDRIGQKKPVKALNFVLENTIEYRVQEVLESKLTVILSDFGVDKMGDVLDSAEVARDFEALYKEALLDPEGIDTEVKRLKTRLRDHIKDADRAKQLYSAEYQVDLTIAQKISEHPLPYWVERMTTSWISSQGGMVTRKLMGYDLVWPDGTAMDNVSFQREQALEQNNRYLSLEEKRVRKLINHLPSTVAGQPIPEVGVKGLSKEIYGYWSLWRISLAGEGIEEVRILPIFKHDDGRTLLPTAGKIWDLLLGSREGFHITGVITTGTGDVFRALESLAMEKGETMFLDLKAKHKERLWQEEKKWRYALETKRRAINQIGLLNVRQHRLRLLAKEEKEWARSLEKRKHFLPELGAITVLYVKGEE